MGSSPVFYTEKNKMHPVHRIFGRRFCKNRGKMACFTKNGVEKRNVIFGMDLLT